MLHAPSLFFCTFFHNQRSEREQKQRDGFFADGKVARNELEITFVSDTEICCVPLSFSLALLSSLERPSNYGALVLKEGRERAGAINISLARLFTIHALCACHIV